MLIIWHKDSVRREKYQIHFKTQNLERLNCKTFGRGIIKRMLNIAYKTSGDLVESINIIFFWDMC